MINKIHKIYIFLIIFLSLPIFFNGKIQKTEEEIRKTQQIIAQKVNIKKEYEQKEKDVLKELKTLDVAIHKLDLEEKILKQKIGQIEQKIKVLSNEIEILDTDIEFYSRFLGIELNEYVLNYVIFTPFYENNFDRKIKKIAMRARYEQLRDINNKKLYSSKIRNENLAQKEQLERYQNLLSQKRQQQKDLLVKKNTLLTQLRRQKTKLEEEIAQLKTTQENLENLLKKLRDKEAKKLSSKTQKIFEVPRIDKKFPYPTKGEIVCKFGKEKVDDKNLCIVRNGIIIQTVGNNDVFSIDKGKVIFISNNFRSYGKMVIIEHSDEIYSVYGQLGEIFVSEGNNVLKQQVIGKTNSEGQLYFELRKNLIPINPEFYLE